ncbi:MAG: N-acetylmuramic acid 6-phosphate etherase [Acidobacteriia bacterium]|nr:N-acetylmuramic acid 6-phosphate etherase [Terriglobia bacterium]
MARKSPKATEQRNPRTRGLSAKSASEIVRAIHREDVSVAKAVAKALPEISRAVEALVNALNSGGRIFYIGAGTSGRLAALDAAELPPTFGTAPRLVQAVIAGGRRALTGAVEGAEDNRSQGARDLAARGLLANDAVVCIAASGSTPYVLGALEFANRKGCATIGITSNPGTPITRIAQISIVTPTGPEPITGSTRMKAGTSQKMVLNMLSTAAMVRRGRVYDNWMIAVALTNRKLRERGLRILMEASGATVADATRALRLSGHDMGVAFIILKTGASAQQARKRLRDTNGNVHDAIQSAKQDAGGPRSARGATPAHG